MPSPVRLSRRTAITASLAASAVLTGCDIDPPSDDDTGSSPTPEPPEDSDLVLATVAGIAEAEALATAASQELPGLEALLAPLAAAHAAHRALLVEALPEDESGRPPAPVVPRRARPALVRVRDLERRLLGQVEAACTGAASGDLARVLASIAASTAQHLVLIDAELAR